MHPSLGNVPRRERERERERERKRERESMNYCSYGCEYNHKNGKKLQETVIVKCMDVDVRMCARILCRSGCMLFVGGYGMSGVSGCWD